MIKLLSPLSGWVTPLGEVPDAVFAGSMLGGGVAIDPSEGVLRAPGKGRIVSVHAARHAVTLELDCGPVLLMHIGLDTVALEGQGFTVHSAEGDLVEPGAALITFDIDFLARRARSLVTPVIVTNEDAFAIRAIAPEGVISAAETLLQVEPLDVAAGQPVEPAGGAVHRRSLALKLANGLHARPAARLAELAKQHEASIAIVAADGRKASCRSAVAMLAMSLRHGEEFVLEADGRDANAALDAIAELLESGMGELREIAAARTVTSGVVQDAPDPGTPSVLSGIVAVGGTAIGPAHLVQHYQIAPDRDAADPEAESGALTRAIAIVRAEIQIAATRDGPQGAIAEAHRVLLDDPELIELAQGQITAGRSAGFAWNAAIEHFAEPLRASSDRRFAARVADLEDLSLQVLAALRGGSPHGELPPPGAILVGHEILPSQLMHLARAAPSGLALGAGGASSHVAIIAAGMGLPMLCGLGAQVSLIASGTDLVLRGKTLLVGPEPEVLEQARAGVAAEADRMAAARQRAHEPALTADEHRIEVFANLGSADDARRAAAEGAEGCGLLRTEFLFLDRSSPPSREEQRQAYQDIADALGPRPLIVRTLDIGADKPVAWLDQPCEDNPALGLRGIRLQLAHADLLETQLAALVDVFAPGGLRIMLPMITDLSEVVETRAVLKRIADQAGVAAPELGIMVETPAAALIATSLGEVADFFSIGSNDLSQYALARDRTAASVAADLDALHPAVLRLIDATVNGAARHGRWTGLCGGLAADPLAVPVLIGLGLTELSMPPASIAMAKQVIRGLNLDNCRELAGRALQAADAASVRALSAAMLEATS